MGLILGLTGWMALSFTTLEQRQAHGPMNTGHDLLRCEACHRLAPGTVRQQIQANLRYFLRLRRTAADFGAKQVDNDACLECHRRPDDRHPVFRFFEPRFQEVRSQLGPHRCLACHLEHQGRRVTVAEAGFCRHCHEKTRLKKDPLSPSHEHLIEDKRWGSCLGCHDFHGNHLHKPPVKLAERVPEAAILDYFAGGKSPYGEEKRFQAKRRVHYEY